uniref:30S ribosomal protein S10ic n=1 Tax=Rhizophora mucronata TaxID=61149 RepID=A0A2P2JNA4_RHIMU
MAVLSSISTAIMPSLSISNSPSLTSKPAMLPPFSSFSLTCRSVDTGFVRILKASPSPRRVFAAPEVVESQDTLDPPAETLGGPDSDSFEVCFYIPSFVFVSWSFAWLLRKYGDWRKVNKCLFFLTF